MLFLLIKIISCIISYFMCIERSWGNKINILHYEFNWELYSQYYDDYEGLLEWSSAARSVCRTVDSKAARASSSLQLTRSKIFQRLAEGYVVHEEGRRGICRPWRGPMRDVSSMKRAKLCATAVYRSNHIIARELPLKSDSRPQGMPLRWFWWPCTGGYKLMI
jgi:hypothetical protein